MTALGCGWVSWQKAKGGARTDTIERLAVFKAGVYTYRPTRLGRVVQHLPKDFQERIARFVGQGALQYPSTVLATHITANDIPAITVELRKLRELEDVVVMERQLESSDLERMRLALPGVRVSEAAFISGAIMYR